jgi:nucleoside-diphosphate-sugar epimerase
MITSDKVYDNVECVWGHRENDRLGGKDPYSTSKGMAELAIRTFVDFYFKHTDTNIRIGIARAGNVIGGGDWEGDRIMPNFEAMFKNIIDNYEPQCRVVYEYWRKNHSPEVVSEIFLAQAERAKADFDDKIKFS